jgi:hypothetical protein
MFRTRFRKEIVAVPILSRFLRKGGEAFTRRFLTIKFAAPVALTTTIPGTH